MSHFLNTKYNFACIYTYIFLVTSVQEDSCRRTNLVLDNKKKRFWEDKRTNKSSPLANDNRGFAVCN